MKILKYGEGYPKTVICEQCNSELEYGVQDIFERADIYMDRIERFKYIKCPVCGETITFDIIFTEPEQPKKKRWWEGWL